MEQETTTLEIRVTVLNQDDVYWRAEATDSSGETLDLLGGHLANLVGLEATMTSLTDRMIALFGERHSPF